MTSPAQSSSPPTYPQPYFSRRDVTVTCSPRMNQRRGQAQGYVDALKALYAPPMTPDELAAYDSLRAAEMARAEARRNPSPQLELGDTDA